MESQGTNDGLSADTPPVTPPPTNWQPAAPNITHSPVPYNPFGELLGMFKSIVWSAGFISFITVILFSFVIVMAMTPDIQNWISVPYLNSAEPPVLVHHKVSIFIIVPWYVQLFTLSGAGFQAWHIIILGTLVAVFSYALYDLFRGWSSKKDMVSVSLTVPEKANSSLEAVAKLFMASLFFSVAYFLLLDAVGVQPNVPAFEEMAVPARIFSFFSASVFEELITRVLLIGVPIVIIGFILKWKNPAKKILGGGLDITPITMSLITFSAIIFAFGHVGSWDYWKIPQVLIPGFALGYAFVRYGLHASVLIHFSINMYSVATEIWPGNMAIELLLSSALLIWLVAGGYFFFRYIFDLANKMIKTVASPASSAAPTAAQKFAAPNVQQPPYMPPPAWQDPYSSGGFVCPNCRYTAANYDSGRLTCLKCGTAQMKHQPEPKAEEKVQIEF